ncbi:MAG: 4-oxalomesaconate tautomerase [Pseudomonadota bacterium]|nr:4-oxalomesaconate tautomerase [Pseudomonadota bacterium]
MQTAIPAIFMRGGTSRGLYFNKADLPEDRLLWDEILLRAFGSPDPRQIDGVGGTTSVTSKTCIISPSARDGSDVDFLFAQVSVDEAKVDYGPTCGNMLAGVGPFAIETGMVKAEDGETRIRIHQVNTDGLVEAVIPTPGRSVEFEGDVAIDGVPGTGSPILLNFLQTVGSHTGALFPTRKKIERINGIDVTLIDAAMPVMILRASVVGKSGYETVRELTDDGAFYQQVEPMRREAGIRMGLGDVSDKVVPKIIIAAPPREGGNISSRYFVPDKPHQTHAITGGIALAFACLAEGTVVHDLSVPLETSYLPRFAIEHPAGYLQLSLTVAGELEPPEIEAVGIVRTARIIMQGSIMIPGTFPLT